MIRPQQKGQAALIAVVFMLSLMLSGVFGASAIALKEARVAEGNTKSRNSFFAAEAGVDDAVYRMKNSKNVSPAFSVSLNGATATTTVADIGSGKKEIKSTGNYNGALRGSSAILSTSGGAASFNYGVQTGQGGLRMENSSTLNGSVYSNGDVWGGGSGNITGDVFVASTYKISDPPDIGGNAWAHKIENVSIAKNATSTTAINAASVGKTAYADTFANGSNITGTCFYKTSVSANTNCGSKVSIGSAPLDLPAIPLAISDTQISTWEAQAASGGTYSSPCPYNISSGTVTIGPLKINCDLNVSNSATVILNGPIWVAGDFTLSNSAIVKLPASYGSNSEVIIADNSADRLNSSTINLNNSGVVLGSGAAGSYITLISMNNSAENAGNVAAIKPQNSVNVHIVYAPHGEILVSNSTNLKEITAYRIHMTNSATITYESGLANINFTSGPSGGYSIDSWGETLP